MPPRTPRLPSAVAGRSTIAAKSLCILSAMMLLDGCAYHRVVVAVPNAPDQYYHPVSTTAVGWGVIEEQRVADKCLTNALSEVRVRTSLGQALITVLTLGFVQPARVEYRCSKLPTGVGEIEP